MPFSVINVETNCQYAIAGTDISAVFFTGSEAAKVAKELTASTGQKHQPRVIVDNTWKEREQSRMHDGTYLPVPWRYESWFMPHYDENHYLHQSIEKGGYVAFTESPEKGAADRQTRMRAGAYLHKYFGEHVPHEIITDWATMVTADSESNELKLASTADDIERVYLDGPSSCMSHPADRFQSSVHPVRVYAAGDLAVAYLERGDRVTARSVVWPDKKIFTRIYGDEMRLRSLLMSAGYERGCLDGARLLKMREGKGWVCPYVDSTDCFDVGEKYLILRDSGEVCCNDGEPTGIWPKYDDDDVTYCERCDDDCNGDETTVHSGRNNSVIWCSHCTDNHAFYCSDEGINVEKDHVVHMANGETWSEWRYAREGGMCEFTDERYPLHDLAQVFVRYGGYELWSENVLDENAKRCDATGSWYANDAIVTLPDGSIVGCDTSAALNAAADEAGPAKRASHPTERNPDQSEMAI